MSRAAHAPASAAWQVALLASGLTCGCTLMGLSEGLERERCPEDDIEFCDGLNDRDDPNFDPCMRWQCNPDTRLCEVSPLDFDGDGFSPARAEDGTMCSERLDLASADIDCDDGNEDRNRSLEERCDFIDNDCDGRSDEGEWQTTAPQALVTAVGEVAHQAYARLQEGAREIGVAYGRTSNQGVVEPGAALSPPDLGGSRAAQPLAIHVEGSALDPGALVSEGVALAALPPRGRDMEERLALAVVNRTTTTHPDSDALIHQRIVVGWVEAEGDSGHLRLREGAWRPGIPCTDASGALCDAQTRLTTPSLAAMPDSDALLLVYVRTSDAERSCQNASGEVLATHVRRVRDRDDVWLEPVPDSTLTLGQTRDVGAPAVLGLAPFADDTPFGWLVAFPLADGGIQLQRVYLDGADLKREPLGDGAVATDVAEPSHVALARGPGADGRQTVALTYLGGCDNRGSADFRSLEVRTEDPAELTYGVGPRVTVDDRRAIKRHPVAAYLPARMAPGGQRLNAQWLVAWTSDAPPGMAGPGGVAGQRLYARTVSPEGDLLDPAPRVLMTRNDEEAEVSGAPFVFSYAEDPMESGLFGVLGYTRDRDGGGQLQGTRLGCFE